MLLRLLPLEMIMKFCVQWKLVINYMGTQERHPERSEHYAAQIFTLSFLLIMDLLVVATRGLTFSFE